MALSRSLGLRSLTLAVVSGTIGSGWLFAPFYAARSAGAASLIAWLLGGVLAFGLAMVFAELGALVPSSGALAQIPMLSHGRLAGFIGGWCAWVAYLALPTIEVLAMIEYLASDLPWLTLDGGQGQVLSPWGMAFAALLLVLMTWVNLAGVRTLARWIDTLTSWKLVIPLLISAVLMLSASDWSNLLVTVGAPGAGENWLPGIVHAISSGGILFSLLGFRTAMDLAGEARDPQRTVPLAMGLGLGLSIAIYLALQLAFLVAVPHSSLGAGWGALQLSAHGGPLAAIAMGLGLSWVVGLLLSDAVISPGATAMTYLGLSGRVAWMMGSLRLLPRRLEHLNRQAVPSTALILSLVIGVVMLLLGPSWQQIVSFLTACLVIALAVGPVSLLALRQQLPTAHRAFALPAAALVCPLTFMAASWAVLWCGRTAVEGAIALVLVPALIFTGVNRWQGRPLDGAHGRWWFGYLIGLLLIAELSGSNRLIPGGELTQIALASAFSLAIFPFAVRSRLPQVSSEAQVQIN